MARVPFVDLSFQHEPLQAQIEQLWRDCIAQGQFILGPHLAAFEQAFAAASGVAYGIGVASGTDALALGMRAAGIQSGDEVLVPANTFIATLIGVLRTGATPVLVDCDPDTALIDLEAAVQKMTPRTKAIAPVHLYGQLVAPQALKDFAQSHNLLIIEDAAQAHLAHRDGAIAGSIGTVAAYSFYPSKNLGAMGDGGMVLTDDPEIASKIRAYRNYGAREKYIHQEWGTNSRLDNLQAAVLGLKLPHLPAWNAARHQRAEEYTTALASLPGICPLVNHSGPGHSYHLYVIRVQPPLEREKLQAALTAAGIQTGIHYPIPCHLQPAYGFLGYQPGDFPVTEQLAAAILSLPMFPGLTAAQVETVVAAIRDSVPIASHCSSH